MGYIEEIRISGYKKFTNFTLQLKEGLNILIGENSVGKSTILEAIEIALNQSMFKYDYSQLGSLLNVDNVDSFKNSKEHRLEDLPKIKIEVYLNLAKVPKFQKFLGQYYSGFKTGDPLKSGISFLFEFDKEYTDIFNRLDFDSTQSIPLEYYHAVWNTFQGNSYRSYQNPLKSILVDSTNYVRDVYGTYSKKIYGIQIDDVLKRQISFDFKEAAKEALRRHENDLTIGKRKFVLNQNKAKLSDLIDISEDNISIQNMGKGQESILKADLSLNTKAELVMIEEPENHLSYSNTRRMIDGIKNKATQVCQTIVTTHESMILNRLNLGRAIWIQEDSGMSLCSLSSGDKEFFEKNDDFDILKFILGEKIILVEGASEYILLPSLIKQVTGNNIDELGISILSVHGIRYKRFINIAKQLKKRVLIFTDNDETKIDSIAAENEALADYPIRIETQSNSKIFTLEYAIYEKNQSLFQEFANGHKIDNLLYKSKPELPKPLVFALKNKTDFALFLSSKVEQDGESVEWPDYLKRGIKWLQN